MLRCTAIMPCIWGGQEAQPLNHGACPPLGGDGHDKAVAHGDAMPELEREHCTLRADDKEDRVIGINMATEEGVFQATSGSRQNSAAV